jgi:hypothetical protein
MNRKKNSDADMDFDPVQTFEIDITAFPLLPTFFLSNNSEQSKICEQSHSKMWRFQGSGKLKTGSATPQYR